MGIFNNEFVNFLDRQEIQRSYNFFVSIYHDDILGSSKTNPFNINLIKNWHVLNVSVPQYDFKKEVQRHGPFPKTFPVLEFDGFELKITFQEDEKGTIAYMVNWLQRKILKSNGIYEYPSKAKINSIVVRVVDQAWVDVVTYNFKDAYFLKADEIQYDYAANDSIKYNVIFGCDFYETTFHSKELGKKNSSQENTRILRDINRQR